jgi:hypothetical protein
MRTSWQLEGQRVEGKYLNEIPFTGIVTNSRVKYGGKIQHTVSLDEPLTAYGRDRDTLLVVEGEDEFNVVFKQHYA